MGLRKKIDYEKKFASVPGLKYGVDYKKTFTAVMSHTTLRLLLSLSYHLVYDLFHYDFMAAFLKRTMICKKPILC